MKGYGQFCAVARALEVLGERWTLLIVRELLMGATTFTQISRGLPRLPRATLSSRLTSLTQQGIVGRTEHGYRLTETGMALSGVLKDLARWATETDAAGLGPEDLDAAALTWDIQRRVEVDALPDRLIVLAIEFTDRPVGHRHYWLHLSPSRVDLCRQDTGTPVDLWLKAPLETLTRWWLGELDWSHLVRQQGVTIQGDRALRSEMERWFKRYLFTSEALGLAPAGG